MQLLQKIHSPDWGTCPTLLGFYDDLAKNPYCTDEKGTCYPRTKSHAIRHAYIQPNHPQLVKWLVFDIDKPNAVFTYHDNNLPRPQIIIRNPDNGHAHYCYRLTAPVAMWGKAHVKPIEYLRAVYNALSRALGADFSFGGNLIKNPTHSKHDTFLTGAKSSYSLDELAQFLDLTTKPDPTPQNDDYFGRNCTLFHQVRLIAYRIADYYDEKTLYRELLLLLEKNNLAFDTGLQYGELRHIAKSITRYCKSSRFQAHRKAYNARFSTLQAKRGSKGGKVSKRPPSEQSERTRKPWEDLGISRATYYRKQKSIENETK